MKKYKPKLKHIIIGAVFTLLITAVIVLAATVTFLGDLVTHERSTRIWDTKLIYTCYNNKIYPCDENGVSRWNEQNPDKAITDSYLKSPAF